MSVYRVYLPPEAEGNFSHNFRLIPDKKAVLALIAPPVWMIWHRLWLPLLAYCVAVFGIVLLSVWQPSPMVGILSALPGLYILLEGRELIANRLVSRGWREVAAVEAPDKHSAEIKFIMGADEAGLLDDQPNSPAKPSRMISATASGPSIGLFPE